MNSEERIFYENILNLYWQYYSSILRNSEVSSLGSQQNINLANEAFLSPSRVDLFKRVASLPRSDCILSDCGVDQLLPGVKNTAATDRKQACQDDKNKSCTSSLDTLNQEIDNTEALDRGTFKIASQVSNCGQTVVHQLPRYNLSQSDETTTPVLEQKIPQDNHQINQTTSFTSNPQVMNGEDAVELSLNQLVELLSYFKELDAVKRELIKADCIIDNTLNFNYSENTNDQLCGYPASKRSVKKPKKSKIIAGETITLARQKLTNSNLSCKKSIEKRAELKSLGLKRVSRKWLKFNSNKPLDSARNELELSELKATCADSTLLKSARTGNSYSDEIYTQQGKDKDSSIKLLTAQSKPKSLKSKIFELKKMSKSSFGKK